MSSPGYFKRESLVGKSVVSKSAEIIGTVSDLAVSLDGKVAIQVQRKVSTGSTFEDLFVGADEIQAVGDVILLKTTSDTVGKGAVSSTAPVLTQTVVAPPPPPGASPQGKTCQKCGYMNTPTAKFCIKCGSALV